MSDPKAARFLRTAAVLSVASGAAVAIGGWLRDPAAMPWGLGGWLTAASIGVAGGAWLASRHGRPDWGFVVALLASMLARLIGVVAGAGLAVWSGGNGLWVFVGGFAAGFAPLQIWEAVFFHQESRGASANPLHPAQAGPDGKSR